MAKLQKDAQQRSLRGSSGSVGEKSLSSMSNSDIISSLGSAKSMPGALRAKMEGSFGMSLSDVSLYESPLVSQSGALAAASGSRIAFAPGQFDPYSASGQKLIGHELSHIVSQKKGEVSGSGVLRDASLERQADEEGSRAALGEDINK